MTNTHTTISDTELADGFGETAAVVAARLGWTCEIISRGDEAKWSRNCARLHDPHSTRGLNLSAQADPTRWEVVGLYDEVGNPYGEDGPKVRQTWISRRPEHLADDIARRFLPPYDAAHRRAETRGAEVRAARARIETLTASLTDLLPGARRSHVNADPIHAETHRTFPETIRWNADRSVAGTWRPAPMADLRCSDGPNGSEVELRVSDLNAEEARALVDVLATMNRHSPAAAPAA